jgi:hypothetical protein
MVLFIFTNTFLESWKTGFENKFLEMLLFINLNHIFFLFTPHILLLFFRLESVFPSVRSIFFFLQFDFFRSDVP